MRVVDFPGNCINAFRRCIEATGRVRFQGREQKKSIMND